MAIADVLKKLGDAFVEDQRAKNGVAAERTASASEADNSLIKRAQAAQVLQKLQSQPALDASEIKLRDAQTELYRNHGTSYLTPKPVNVGDYDPVTVDGQMVGYRSKKAGPDGQLRFLDTQGQPMNGPMVAAPPSVSIGSDKPAAPSAAPIPPSVAGPATAAAAALASVGGKPGAPPKGGLSNIPTAPYNPKAPKAPTKAPRPHYISGTGPDGKPGFFDSSTLQPAPNTGVTPPLPITERTRVDQAGHVIEQGEALLKEYDQNPDLFGASGVLNDFKTNHSMATMALGQPDARWSHLKAAETSLSAFQPIMHGSRGGEGLLQHFQQNIAPNPAIGVEQRKAAVSALIEAAKRIQQYGPEADLSDLHGAVSAQPSASPKPGGFKYLGVVKQ